MPDETKTFNIQRPTSKRLRGNWDGLLQEYVSPRSGRRVADRGGRVARATHGGVAGTAHFLTHNEIYPS
jgi:hypothetical protein